MRWRRQNYTSAVTLGVAVLKFNGLCEDYRRGRTFSIFVLQWLHRQLLFSPLQDQPSLGRAEAWRPSPRPFGLVHSLAPHLPAGRSINSELERDTKLSEQGFHEIALQASSIALDF